MPAQAGLVPLALQDLQSNDQIDWGSLGGDLTALAPPTGLTTLMGLAATVSGPTALAVFSGSTYNADFLAGDFVISAYDLNTFTALLAGIQIDLPAHIRGFGAQVQVNSYGPFSATLDAYDSTLTLLGSITIGGINGANGDGSAAFLGAGSSDTDIARVVITSDGAALALDTAYLNVAPEPSTMLLGVSALGALLLRRKHSRG